MHQRIKERDREIQLSRFLKPFLNTSISSSLRTADVSPRTSPLREVSREGTSATQRQKFHTDDAILSRIRSEALIGRRRSFIVLAIVYE